MRKRLAALIAAFGLLVSAGIASAQTDRQAGQAVHGKQCNLALPTVTGNRVAPTVTTTGSCGAGVGLNWHVWARCNKGPAKSWEYENTGNGALVRLKTFGPGTTCGYGFDLNPVLTGPSQVITTGYDVSVIGGLTLPKPIATVRLPKHLKLP